MRRKMGDTLMKILLDQQDTNTKQLKYIQELTERDELKTLLLEKEMKRSGEFEEKLKIAEEKLKATEEKLKESQDELAL